MRMLGITLAIVSTIVFVLNGWIIFSHPQAFEGFAIDRPMHAAGGAVVALFAGLVIFTGRAFSPLRGLSRPALVLALISFAVFVGVLWELYEFAWDVFVADAIGALPAQPDPRDTMEDLLADFLGGIAGAFLFAYVLKPRA